MSYIKPIAGFVRNHHKIDSSWTGNNASREWHHHRLKLPQLPLVFRLLQHPSFVPTPLAPHDRWTRTLPQPNRQMQ
eukprot:2946128-Prorocentrum_lima.AAC.1